MADFSIDDTTKQLVGPDKKFGKFEPDPNDEFVQRYIPSASELANIESWLREELDRALVDDQPSRNNKLDLLNAYHAKPEGQQQILVLPLVKRAVNQNVAWVKNTIMQKRPLVTVTPDSGGTITVLVDDPKYGPVPIEKSSEEVAKALEAWCEYKLRRKIDFDSIVETAVFEAKRGQTPTWIAVRHKKETRKIRAPKFEKSGPVAVTFQTKDEIDVAVGEATRLENVSTYRMLMPLDEQEPQNSRWLAEHILPSNEDMRRAFYGGDYYLVRDKALWEDIIGQEGDNDLTPDEAKKAANERRTPSVPKGRHDVWLVWFFWTVPMKSALVSIDGETGEQTQKSITTNQEYSFCGYFHKKAGRLLSMIRNPFDHGQRPYVPVFDRKEPFRHSGGSIAEDVLPYQRVNSQLNSLEIRGGIIATTPVTFAEPGSTAGEWVAQNGIDVGQIIPRLRPEEIETKVLGERPQSLLGLISFHNSEYEKQTSIGQLQLGLEIPGRTPASTLAQALSAGETQAAMFLDTFRDDLSDAVKLYVQTVQQYMRFGEVIPFDPETKATIEAALQPDQQAGTGIPVRFPMEPVHNQFAFNITASSEDRSQQGDFEKLVSLKKLIDADGAIVAQMIGPLASGQLPPTVSALLVEDFKRREKVMELIAKAMRKDGADFAIDPKLLVAMVNEQQQVAQAAQAAQNGVPSENPQGAGVPNGGGVPPNPNSAPGLGSAIPQSGIPPMPIPNQAGAPSPFGGPTIQ